MARYGGVGESLIHLFDSMEVKFWQLTRRQDHQLVAGLELAAEQEAIGGAQRFHSGPVGPGNRPEGLARLDAVDDHPAVAGGPVTLLSADAPLPSASLECDFTPAGGVRPPG